MNVKHLPILCSEQADVWAGFRSSALITNVQQWEKKTVLKHFGELQNIGTSRCNALLSPSACEKSEKTCTQAQNQHSDTGQKSHVQQYQKQRKSPTITTMQQNPGQQWKVGHFECIQELYLHKELDRGQEDICQVNQGRSGARPPSRPDSPAALSSLTFGTKAGFRQPRNKCDFS